MQLASTNRGDGERKGTEEKGCRRDLGISIKEEEKPSAESFSERAAAKYHISPVTLLILIIFMASILFSSSFSGANESVHLVKRSPRCKLEICEAVQTQEC